METIVNLLNTAVADFEKKAAQYPEMKIQGSELEEVNNLMQALYYANLVVEQQAAAPAPAA